MYTCDVVKMQMHLPTHAPPSSTFDSDNAVRAADRIYAALVDRILSGELRPGQVLSEVQLAESFGLSRTPVREALQHLSIAGLAQRGPRRAFMVRRLDEPALNDLFETMGEIEALCAQYSARRMTAVERQALREIVEEGAACVEAGDAERYAAINARFHQALFDGAHNASLREMAQILRVRTAPYREAQFRKTDRLGSSQREHQRVVAAITAEEPRKAFEAMRGHVTETALNVMRMLGMRQER